MAAKTRKRGHGKGQKGRSKDGIKRYRRSGRCAGPRRSEKDGASEMKEAANGGGLAFRSCGKAEHIFSISLLRQAKECRERHQSRPRSSLTHSPDALPLREKRIWRTVLLTWRYATPSKGHSKIQKGPNAVSVLTTKKGHSSFQKGPPSRIVMEGALLEPKGTADLGLSGKGPGTYLPKRTYCERRTNSVHCLLRSIPAGAGQGSMGAI